MPGRQSDKQLELQHFDLAEFVRRVLAEDLGSGGDVTSNATIAADARFTAELSCREPITVAGLDVAIAFFRALERDVQVRKNVRDGDSVAAGSVLMRLDGHARALLAAERSALNTLQHLSGIATLTRRYVDAIEGTGAILLDTRKTIPGLRMLEKYATRMGGAQRIRLHIVQQQAIGACRQRRFDLLQPVDLALDLQADVRCLGGGDRLLDPAGHGDMIVLDQDAVI